MFEQSTTICLKNLKITKEMSFIEIIDTMEVILIKLNCENYNNLNINKIKLILRGALMLHSCMEISKLNKYNCPYIENEVRNRLELKYCYWLSIEYKNTITKNPLCYYASKILTSYDNEKYLNLILKYFKKFAYQTEFKIFFKNIYFELEKMFISHIIKFTNRSHVGLLSIKKESSVTNRNEIAIINGLFDFNSKNNIQIEIHRYLFNKQLTNDTISQLFSLFLIEEKHLIYKESQIIFNYYLKSMKDSKSDKTIIWYQLFALLEEGDNSISLFYSCLKRLSFYNSFIAMLEEYFSIMTKNKIVDGDQYDCVWWATYNNNHDAFIYLADVAAICSILLRQQSPVRNQFVSDTRSFSLPQDVYENFIELVESCF